MATCRNCGKEVVIRKTCGVSLKYEFVSNDKRKQVYIKKGQAPADTTILTRRGQVVTGKELHIRGAHIDEYLKDVYRGWPLKKHICAAAKQLQAKALRVCGD
jgi:hypothetical protein